MADQQEAAAEGRLIRGIVVVEEDRVYIDLADLTANLRRRGRWWVAQADGLAAHGEELSDDELVLIAVARGIAAELDDRADQLDCEGMGIRTALAG